MESKFNGKPIENIQSKVMRDYHSFSEICLVYRLVVFLSFLPLILLVASMVQPLFRYLLISPVILFPLFPLQFLVVFAAVTLKIIFLTIHVCVILDTFTLLSFLNNCPIYDVTPTTSYVHPIYHVNVYVPITFPYSFFRLVYLLL